MTPQKRNRLRIEADRLLRKGKAKKSAKKAGQPRPASIPTQWAVRNRTKLLAKPNKAEEHIEATLKLCGLLYVREAPVRHQGKEYFMDFAVETNLGIVAIEVDGSQHFTPKGQSLDRKRDRAILDSGEAVSIIRLSWKEALGIGMHLRALVLWSCEWPGSVIIRY